MNEGKKGSTPRLFWKLFPSETGQTRKELRRVSAFPVCHPTAHPRLLAWEQEPSCNQPFSPLAPEWGLFAQRRTAAAPSPPHTGCGVTYCTVPFGPEDAKLPPIPGLLLLTLELLRGITYLHL